MPVNKINPMLPACNTHDVTSYILLNQFRSVAGKSLGIMLGANVTYRKAYQTYGFTKAFVGGQTDIDSAIVAGFSHSNLMFGLGDNPYAAYTLVQGYKSSVGSFYIDEPQEKDTWSYNQIVSVNGNITPMKLFIGSYKDPPYEDYGIISQISNVYLMCDEYHGDLNGAANDYWDNFRGYYITKNISDWISSMINNPSSGATRLCYPWDHSTSWYDLLNNALIYGTNEV